MLFESKNALYSNRRGVRPVLRYQIGLIMLLISNICFYTENTIPVYVGVSCLSFILISLGERPFSLRRFRLDSFSVWLIVLYLSYTIYGCFFLRADFYNWDMMIFTGFSDFFLYIALYEILKSDDYINNLRLPILVSSLFCVLYIYFTSKGVIGEDEIRIGTELSGNVNTVAVSLGILSLIVVFTYLKTKAKLDLIVLIALVAFLLLTGSKKALVYIFFDFIMIIRLSKSKISKYVIIGISIIVVYYVVMKVPYFYSVIGHRIQDLFFQIFGVGVGSFSNKNDRSSLIRLAMIVDGFRIYISHPQYYLFGGGEKFFALESAYGLMFHYSHCNYVEMLCNYGLFGIALFYFPLISNLKKIRRYLLVNYELALFGILGIVSVFVNSWLMVIYQEICISYIPIVFSFAIIKVMTEDSYNVKAHHCYHATEKR